MQRKDSQGRLAHIAAIDRVRPSSNVESLTPSALMPQRNALGAASDRPSPSVAEWHALLGGAELAAAEWRALSGLAQLRVLPVGALVFSRAQPGDRLVAVLEGAVGLGQLRHDQPFHLERTVRGPAWLDLASAWLGRSHMQDARVLSEARIVELEIGGVRELLRRHPAMAERLLGGLAQTVRSLTGVTHDLMHKDAERRLAAWLLQLSSRSAQGPDRVSLGERKRDIAAQLAITPETLSRMMRQLKLKGLIEVQGYAVRLLDIAALQALAAD